MLLRSAQCGASVQSDFLTFFTPRLLISNHARRFHTIRMCATSISVATPATPSWSSGVQSVRPTPKQALASLPESCIAMFDRGFSTRGMY